MLKVVKKHIWKILLLVVAIFLAIIGYYQLQPEKLARKHVKVGFFEYPPYNMSDPVTGKPTGYCVDILNAVAKNQNIEIEYVKTMFINYKENIPKGSPYKMGLPIIITEAREKIYDFSWPCEENDTVLVVLKGSKHNTAEALKNMCIGSVQGVEKAYCQKLLKSGKVKAHKDFHSTANLYKALLNGTVDAVINDRGISTYFRDKYPDKIEITPVVFFSQYEGFPIQKKQKWLLKRINTGLRNIMNSGEYSRIYLKYFTAN